MIAVDTNVLVYAHRRDSPFHDQASSTVRQLAQSPAPWAIPWPCVHEFYAIVTHPRIYSPPSTAKQAITQLDSWLASPSLVLLAEGSEHWPTLRRLLTAARTAGPAIHDARIAALCVAHGVRELVTLDRDFARFPELSTSSLLAGD